MVLSFGSYPLWLNVLIFAVSAGVIWFAGVRLERYADTIAERTNLGQAFTGMLLLSATTSLPEIATVVTAVAFLDNPVLAVHNLVGAVALQTGILVAADRAKHRRGALTYHSPQFVLLIEGVGLLVLLQLTIAGVAARGFPTVFSVGMWPAVTFIAYLGVMYLVYHFRQRPQWKPIRTDDASSEHSEEHESAASDDQRTPEDDRRESDELQRETHRHPLRRVLLLFSAAGLAVLLGGWAAAQSADVLAEQTGLGPEFLGATFLALAGALPELSTTIAASRNDRYSMAISNVFGSNAFDINLLFLADLLYRGGAIMEDAGWTVVFVTGIGSAMVCLYLWGLLTRQNRAAFGVGWDSVAALVLYLGAMTVLYFIR